MDNKLPHYPSEDDIKNLCRDYDFTEDQSERFRKCLNGIVYRSNFVTPKWTDKQKNQLQERTFRYSQQTKKEKIDVAKDIHKHIEKTHKRLKKLLPTKGSGVNPAISQVNKALSDSVSTFLVERGSPGLLSTGSLQHGIRCYGIQTLTELLEVIKTSLDEIIERNKKSRPRGGRNPDRRRRTVIKQLLAFLQSAGMNIKQAKYSDFIEAVFGATGLPTHGVSEDIPRAINEWEGDKEYFKNKDQLQN